MNFGINNIKTMYESNNSTDDKVGYNLDNTLGNSDMMDVFNDICPISGEVFAAMKKTAGDPKNLKIAMTKNGDGEHSLFIEAVEFMTFCEAADMDEGEAADAIVKTYEGEIPGIGVKDINVVFPSDALSKNIIGSENNGIDTRKDWAMKLMFGCRRFGMKPRIAINESENINEASYDKFKGIKIDNYGDKNFLENNKDNIKYTINIVNNNWDKIIKYASNELFNIIKSGYKDKSINDKFKNVESIEKSIYPIHVEYKFIKNKAHELDITFDFKKEIDKNHKLKVYISINKDNNISMNSSYDG